MVVARKRRKQTNQRRLEVVDTWVRIAKEQEVGSRK
jgi:hypothetical protein